MACSNIRYGPGVTKEVGMDLVNLKAKHVGVYTDKNLMKLGPMKATLDSLTKAGVNFTVKVESNNGAMHSLHNIKNKKLGNFFCQIVVGNRKLLKNFKKMKIN
jgi:hydroxyacid-oxoacid transhydrogenase